MIALNAGHIILPRRFVDLEAPANTVGASGEYNLVKIHGETGRVISETGWFPNLILDQGLNRWGTNTIILGAAIGTDSTPPTNVQTGLLAQTTYTTTTGAGHGTKGVQGSAPYFGTTTYVYRTALGALNGNYSEVGVGWASGGSMFSRALIVDSGGTPTTLTVLSTEQLDIQYRLRYYPPTVDVTTVKTIGGVAYNITGRASGVSSNLTTVWLGTTVIMGNAGTHTQAAYSGAIGSVTAAPSGTSDFFGNPTNNAYSNNSLQWTGAVNASLLQANVAGGMRSLYAEMSMGIFQYDFGASIPKDGTKTLVMNLSVNWARRP